MGEILSAFEFFDNESLQLTVDVLPHIQPPLKFKSSPFYAIIETAGSNDKHDQEKFQVHFSPCSNISRTSLMLIRASHHPAKIASKTILLFLVDKHCNLQALQSRAVLFRLEASQAFSGLSPEQLTNSRVNACAASCSELIWTWSQHARSILQGIVAAACDSLCPTGILDSSKAGRAGE